MTAPDELTYERASRRIVRFIAALATLGSLVAWVVWGWKSGAGFLLGSAISGLNFVLLKTLVDRLGERAHAAISCWRSVIRCWLDAPMLS